VKNSLFSFSFLFFFFWSWFFCVLFVGVGGLFVCRPSASASAFGLCPLARGVAPPWWLGLAVVRAIAVPPWSLIAVV